MPLPENRVPECRAACHLSLTTRRGYPCTDACQLVPSPAHGWPRPASPGFADVDRALRDDPIKVLKLAQAVCDACGWHSPIIGSQAGGTAAAMAWAEMHRGSCPAPPRST